MGLRGLYQRHGAATLRRAWNRHLLLPRNRTEQPGRFIRIHRRFGLVTNTKSAILK